MTRISLLPNSEAKDFISDSLLELRVLLIDRSLGPPPNFIVKLIGDQIL